MSATVRSLKSNELNMVTGLQRWGEGDEMGGCTVVSVPAVQLSDAAEGAIVPEEEGVLVGAEGVRGTCNR